MMVESGQYSHFSALGNFYVRCENHMGLRIALSLVATALVL